MTANANALICICFQNPVKTSKNQKCDPVESEILGDWTNIECDGI